MDNLLEKIEASSQQEKGSFKVSKWLSLGVFLSPSTFAKLWDELSPFYLVHSDRVLQENFFSSKESFIKHYSLYFNSLKSGELPNESFFRKYFSFTLSKDLEHYYKMPLGNEKLLIKAQRPVLQSQFFTLGFSFEERKVRSMVMGQNTLFWGLQLSFPQLYQNPSSPAIEKITRGPDFPNAELFYNIQRFCRYHTHPVFFSYKGEKIVSPFRLDNENMDWIDNHPQLRQLEISVIPPKKKKDLA
ncbi:MAG: hypothetical protein GWP59_01005 [Chlamydiales bacterium]|nr:hypothetical protein [Chlamydiales bacterium]NCF70256.1 hypothetical protein [Chlamydiales bacterium]